MFIDLKKNNQIALYEQLYLDIKRKILDGSLHGNMKLPSKRQMSQDLSVSMTTVERAYNLLIDEDLIYTKEKSGHYIVPTEELKVKSKALTAVKKEAPVTMEFPLGAVDTSIVQNDVIKHLSHDVFQDTSLLNSGERSGEAELKTAIKEYLYVNRGVQCTDDQVFIGPSTEYLLEQVFYLLDYPAVTLEDPAYPVVKKVLARLNIPYDTAAVEVDGIDINAVKKHNNKIVHITPSHQFPSGVIMSLNKRIQLLNMLSETNNYIIEDDYDSEFRYTGRPLSSLQGLDQNNKTIYINTFSKSIYPSLRLAVMVLPPELAEKYYDKELACNVSRQMQHIIAKFIREGYLERHINRVRKFYKKKMQVIIEALHDKHPEVILSGYHTGMHFVAKLKGVDLRGLAKENRIISMADYREEIEGNDTVLIGIGSKDESEIIHKLDQFFIEAKKIMTV